ncbi:methane/phenol/toluene hydroxylase (plasmid) [Xanthobacter versatilis]|uniref:Alkene monooxygenase system, oxygenase component subunit alpha n=1 Tax=Xanthobacter autotrophicus (strain ATCC BAA-1158 / Py2) TaxID=78245 RepID=XAMOA_XANP2|nr:RecName: Full=Alkene monooxygenase system, oxygenase component subunit alpha [Xanthobacter autotrophicus Py2]ABS70068.1 methane/phenol/toluene hydroxylase [Xanthobacter autotrophicus Py2]CAA07366.1 alkene monooxygenase [Xanthobacter autotrophicus Py2]CAA09911.1 oxygenase alpha subunit [Xanthobacter autotrophicus Py2]
MALLNRDDWYDIARDVDWTLSYVDRAVAFPEEWKGEKDICGTAWDDWDEPFRVSFREYVMVQRDKEASVGAIREAMVRAKAYEKLDDGHKATSHLHMGTITMVEHMAVTMQSRFVRFAPSARWRSLGAFGMLDETRHTQLDLRFSHDLLNDSPSFDWSQRAFHTDEWAVLATRNLFDDIMLNADCVEAALATSLTLEHGFTNIQFVALASDAMEAGDVNFSNLLSSIQTDEARHAQLGFPTLDVMMKHDPKRAQQILDVAFWRSYRIFQAVTGVSMDYYTPVAKRQMSFKEFMLEWIVKHHERILRDYGLQKPWYWDTFEKTLDHGHHALHIGTWFWRPTLFWDPNGGVSREERRWLNQKYPNWEESWGVLWDEIISNINAGNIEKTLPETLPMLCNVTNLPIGSHWDRFHLKPEQLVYKGRLYTFDSDVSKWIFELDPERYAGHTNVVDRFIGGQIQPMTIEGVLNWMGLTPEVMGKDVFNYRWAGDYAENRIAAE